MTRVHTTSKDKLLKEQVKYLEKILAALNTLDARIHDLQGDLLNIKPGVDIPPLWVRKAALSFSGFKGWDGAYKILCDWYNIPPLKSVVDEKGGTVPKDAVACYYLGTVYSKGSTMSHDTGIHEFYHHLESMKNREYVKGSSEAVTKAYAEAFLEGV